jgi:hypothetical protein
MESPATNQENPEYQLAFQKVADEVNVLIAGDKDLRIPETLELLEYMRKRTDLAKPEDQLSHEQKAWRHFFLNMETSVIDSIGKEAYSDLSKARQDLSEVDVISKNVHEMFSLGRQLEELLLVQGSRLDVHFDDNNYRKNEEFLSMVMLSRDVPVEDRITAAKEILKLVDTYRDVMIKPMQDALDDIYRGLNQFRGLYNSSRFEITDDPRITKIQTLYGEWLDLTEQLYQERIKMVTSVRNLVDMDTFIPNYLIQANGDLNGSIPAEEFQQKAAAAKVFMDTAMEKVNEISERRSALAREAYGDPETYMKVLQQKPESASSVAPAAQANPLEEKAWYRFAKVIFYILCAVAALLAIAFASQDFGTGIIAAGIMAAMLFGIRQAFFYIILGKKRK